ncbi:MBL fold metallo-hydrolase [Gilvimarinus algae]|uniref:MBL fold metallo-hydrolase n=1 Tax=Gilvimarinus algae TaxID=3058037 RepID=A0ABT8TA98_9GAMM|nr:MBL fold metallo-hydrolase [Gilvimarinus sp. SDUM040014]MDO3381046.1 MBL fold metallo-hydrolase [Gilvimarinus sp. SDUM040014]
MLAFRMIPVTHYQQNCSLIWCGTTREAALVDPGGEPDKLLEAIAEVGVRVGKILLTHGHMDHVGAATAMAQSLSVPIIGPHRDDSFWLDRLDQQAQMMGFAPTEAVRPDRWLADGDQISVGDCQLDVLHCPGHTPGHVVLVDRASRLAFVGDVLFKGSVGRSDFPLGDHAVLVRSIVGKLWPLGDDIRFVPGHGPMSDFASERADNPFVADKQFG